MPAKQVTMDDVAREAGVSKATVSYCISHDRPIREETRKKVRDAIEKLGYQPICDRRQTKKKIIAAIKHNYVELQPNWELIERKLHKHGYLVANFIITEENESFAEDILRICSMPDIVGVICYAKFDSMDIFKYCRGIPAIIFQREKSMLSPITLDYRKKIILAKNHLANLGHQQFFMILESQKRSTGVIDIYLNELEDKRMKGQVYFLPIVPSEEEIEALFAELDRLYAEGCRAVITLTFYYSQLIYHWVARRGISIPEDLSVLCLENTSIAHWLLPKLSHVCHPTEEIAEYTVKSLIAKINNEPVENKKFTPRLKLNGSTAPPK